MTLDNICIKTKVQERKYEVFICTTLKKSSLIHPGGLNTFYVCIFQATEDCKRVLFYILDHLIFWSIYIYIYIYIYICMYTHTHTQSYTCMYECALGIHKAGQELLDGWISHSSKCHCLYNEGIKKNIFLCPISTHAKMTARCLAVTCKNKEEHENPQSQ